MNKKKDVVMYNRKELHRRRVYKEHCYVHNSSLMVVKVEYEYLSMTGRSFVGDLDGAAVLYPDYAIAIVKYLQHEHKDKLVRAIRYMDEYNKQRRVEK